MTCLYDKNDAIYRTYVNISGVAVLWLTELFCVCEAETHLHVLHVHIYTPEATFNPATYVCTKTTDTEFTHHLFSLKRYINSFHNWMTQFIEWYIWKWLTQKLH